MKLTSKQISAIVVGGVAAVVILTVMFLVLYRPQIEAISEAKKEAANSAQQGVALSAKLKELQALSANIGQTEQQVNTLYASFPTKADQASWIDMINRAAGDAQVKADAISPGIPQLGVGSADTNSSTAGGGAAAGSSSSTSTSGASTSSTSSTTSSTSSTSSSTNSDATAPSAAATGKPAQEGSQTLANVPVSLSVTGSDAAIRDFLSRVNKLDQPLLVDTFSVSESDGELTANLTGRVVLSREITPPATKGK